MTRSRDITKRLHGQRGYVITWFTLLLPVLFGFMAVSLDLARLYLVKTELQNAADAAALAGAYTYAKENVTKDDATSLDLAKSAANTMAKQNYVNGMLITDVTTEKATVTGYTYAVQSTITFASGNNNGPLKFFFAPIVGLLSGPDATGIDSSNVSATAVAAQNAPGHSRLVQ
jgi:Flp pilus assembly protein TadG